MKENCLKRIFLMAVLGMGTVTFFQGKDIYAAVEIRRVVIGNGDDKRLRPRRIRPRFGHFFDFQVKGNGFHHLSHCSVGKNHRSHSVFIGKFKAFDRKFSHFLNGGRSKNYHMKI